MPFFLFLSILSFSSFSYSVSVSEPEYRTAAHCDTAEDYAISKQGTFGIKGGKVTINVDTLMIEAEISATQCTRLKNNRYQWKSISPLGKMSYEHEYFDRTNKKFKTRTVTVEHKDNWLTATNSSFHIVGTGNVSGTMKKGFFARVAVPLSKLATPEELEQLETGKTQKMNVSLFLKSFLRYISDGEPTPFEESSGAGLYDIAFTVKKINGKFTIE